MRILFLICHGNLTFIIACMVLWMGVYTYGAYKYSNRVKALIRGRVQVTNVLLIFFK